MTERARELRRRMTPAEKRLWDGLREHRLGGYHFRRQQVIGGYIVDFYCAAARLVVEVDGPIHDRQTEYDAERERVLAAYGVTTLHVTNEQVTGDLRSVLIRIVEWINLSLPSQHGSTE
jgi:very-short-patch-repair endonuclease